MKQEVELQIVDGEKKYLSDCIKILQDSDLGNAYFSDEQKAKAMLQHALEKKELHIALNKQGQSVGFIYFMKNGVFGSYPYLHIVAVKEEYRSCGIGSQLLKYFEDKASNSPLAKYFLTVDDFNPRAKKLYENLGYQCVGELPDFYKQGIDCYLMMKKRGD